MNPSTERLQSVLDQELESAIADQRELDYRALFLAELERSTLLTASCSAASLPLGQP